MLESVDDLLLLVSEEWGRFGLDTEMSKAALLNNARVPLIRIRDKHARVLPIDELPYGWEVGDLWLTDGVAHAKITLTRKSSTVDAAVLRYEVEQ